MLTDSIESIIYIAVSLLALSRSSHAHGPYQVWNYKEKTQERDAPAVNRNQTTKIVTTDYLEEARSIHV